jgi:hypothetical protein
MARLRRDLPSTRASQGIARALRPAAVPEMNATVVRRRQVSRCSMALHAGQRHQQQPDKTYRHDE